MSKLLHWFGALLATWSTPRQTGTDPDHMSLHEWADLPPYHPIVDRAPC